MDVLILVFLGALGTGFLSGISGGGGGMLMIPLYIFLGLTPQQAVATGKMNGLGASFGGLAAFHKSGHVNMSIVKVMAPIAIIAGVAAPFVFVRLEGEAMQQIIGVLLLVLAPTVFMKKKVHPDRSARFSRIQHLTGYVVYTVILTIQALFGAGAGTLALFAMTLLFGTTKIEANATRRAVTAILVPISFVALYIAGFIVLSYGIAGMVGAFIGTHYGSKYVLKNGERFAAYATGIMVAFSGVVLLFTAS